MNPPILVILIGLAIPLGIIAASVYRDRSHRAALEAYYQLRGYRFDPDAREPREQWRGRGLRRLFMDDR